MLDKTFGGDGRIALPGSGSFVPRAVAVDRADRIIVGGYRCEPATDDATCLDAGNSSFRVARLTRDGGLDPEFGDNGINTTPMGTGRSQALDVLMMDNGDIVAGGVASVDGRDVFALARFTSSGALVPDFGSGGRVLQPIGSAYAAISDLAEGPNGTILAAGQAVDAAGVPRAAVARFNVVGGLDATFGTGGYTLGGATSYNYALGLAVGPSGSITTAGISGTPVSQTTYGFGELRLSQSGTPNASFGRDGNGSATQRLGTSTSFATSIVPAAHDGFAAAGAALISDGRQAMAIMRGTSAGAFDPSFGSDGYVLIPQADGAAANDLIGYSDGRLLAIGQAARKGYWSFAEARVLASGRPDPSWGRNGVRRLHFPDYPAARATAGALASGGRVVTVGIGCDMGGTGTQCDKGRAILLVARQLDHPARDTTSPHLTLRGLPKRIGARRLRRRGVVLRVRLSEPARLEIVARRGKQRLARRVGKRLVAHDRMRIKMRTRAGRIRVVIRAVDRAGNATVRPFRLTVT
ncbi:MAG: hypothetical protein QOF76_2520 [Solirubrobacteraceae bacterium]|nr:hypothetical protein [Solirubrobacteraceae bacterium]